MDLWIQVYISEHIFMILLYSLILTSFTSILLNNHFLVNASDINFLIINKILKDHQIISHYNAVCLVGFVFQNKPQINLKIWYESLIADLLMLINYILNYNCTLFKFIFIHINFHIKIINTTNLHHLYQRMKATCMPVYFTKENNLIAVIFRLG